MNIWDIIVAIILGIVEGLTEYAPVSSTGHMIIVDDVWLKSKELLTPEAANTFKVVIQLGSILAVAIVFKDRILNLLGMKKNITEEQKSGNRLSIAQIAVGLVPAAVLGFLFEDYIDQYLFFRPHRCGRSHRRCGADARSRLDQSAQGYDRFG